MEKRKNNLSEASCFCKKLIAITTILLTTLLQYQTLYAHHLRAGDITIELDNCVGNTYTIIVTGYTDTRVSLEFGYEVLDFGDGTYIRLDTCQPTLKKDLGDFITVKVFRITHTFPGPGTYFIRYHEPNRNDNVLNMARSGYTAFYVDTKITIDPFLYCNNTPTLLNMPIDKGMVGKKFEHNPSAWDPDGDSLVYKLVHCKQNRDMDVNVYQWPHVHDINKVGATNEEGTAPASLTIDPITGNIEWDAPGIAGQYNIAIMVEEWRFLYGTWHRLGYVTRDMQIIIEKGNNEAPKLLLPLDTCVEAGTTLTAAVQAIDPDGHEVMIEAYSGIFDQFFTAVTVDPDPSVFQSSPGTLNFTWNTHCTHVREKPYQVVFKVKDRPGKNEGPSLVDFDSWFITIVAPAPQGLIAIPLNDDDVRLVWETYRCESADKIQIWRRIGHYEFTPGPCEVGIPVNSGYELIGEVDAGDSIFTDSSGIADFANGSTICYRIVATFPPPRYGVSYVSGEACIIAKDPLKPVITHVDISKTGVDGEIILRWMNLWQIDTAQYPPPFTFNIYRTINSDNSEWELISRNYEDTVFYDTNINTYGDRFYYRVDALDSMGYFLGESSHASSVRLTSVADQSGIKLDWRVEVPWSIISREFPFHYVYRNYADTSDEKMLTLIDSIDVTQTGMQYFDQGQFNNQSLDKEKKYSYFIAVAGTYGNPAIPEPLINRSQIISVLPNDTTPPCVPINLTFGNFVIIDECREFLADKPCDFHNFFNELYWEKDVSGNCDPDVSSFNIYFSCTGMDDEYELIANVTQTYFFHKDLPSFAGCYKISAIDNSGNESQLSAPICHDNCPYYELPNVFTPNDDGKNDSFRAFDKPNSKCPRFVERVNFRVYNRWGFEVYNNEFEIEKSIYIDWNGRDNNKKDLDAGVYYYVAEVSFTAMDPDLSRHIYKGWVHILK
jgi:hypothetical protein